jgi:hypothetical protein
MLEGIVFFSLSSDAHGGADGEATCQAIWLLVPPRALGLSKTDIVPNIAQ